MIKNYTKKILIAISIIFLFTITIYLSFQIKIKRTKIYDPLINKIAKKYNVDSNLIKAIIKKESNFTEKIRGKHKEYGLMQITINAAKDWSKKTGNKLIHSEKYLFQPEINIDIGTWYISQKLLRWKNNPHQKIYSLAAYNAGLRNVKKWLKDKNKKGYDIIQFPSTKNYIKKILQYYNEYSKLKK